MLKKCHILSHPDNENQNFHELILKERAAAIQQTLLYLESDLDKPFYYLKQLR